MSNPTIETQVHLYFETHYIKYYFILIFFISVLEPQGALTWKENIFKDVGTTLAAFYTETMPLSTPLFTKIFHSSSI